jgi:shikimate kinase
MGCIVLVGPMGAGKSTLGKKLAKSLQLPFSDTDKLIEKVHGPIVKIFEAEGEEAFRDYEELALAQALESDGVVATGGGAVLRERNRQAMRGHRVIFLDTNSESVLRRVNLLRRPLLRDNPERWQEIYLRRLDLYKSVASHTLFTGNRPIKALLDELKAKVEDHAN